MPASKENAVHGGIDFLPESYREHNEQRTFHIWQLLALVLLTVMVAAASLYRHHVRRGIEKQIAALVPYYMATGADEARLKSLEEQLAREESAARLVAYLHHPWPRSQILSALLPSLPARITLTSIRVDHVAGGGQAVAAGTRNPSGDNQITVPEEEQLKGARPLRVEHDLKMLHEQCDRAEVVVLLSGVTTETGELYAYLGNLSRNRLFTRAELVSLESVAQSGPAAALPLGAKFRVRLVVCQGYGQPAGPKDTEPPGHESRETHVAQRGAP